MTKEEMIELIQNRISILQDTLTKVASHVPDNIPEDVTFSPGWIGGQFWARIQTGSPSFKILRRQMGRKWALTSSAFYPEDGERVTKYTHRDGTEFLFVLLPPAEGQSCELVKVGERIVNQYEIVCN